MRVVDVAPEAAQRFKERVVEALGDRIREVRIFGSVARGEAHEESDLDLFVLVDERDHDLDEVICKAACDVAFDLEIDCLISPLVMSQAHFELLVSLERLIVRDILAEGIFV